MKTKEVITRVVSPSSVCEAWRRRSCAAAHRRHPGFHIRRRRRRQPGAQGQGRLGEQEDLPGGARGEKRRTRRDFVSRFFAAKALIEILHGEENAEIRRLACFHDIKKIVFAKAMLQKRVCCRLAAAVSGRSFLRFAAASLAALALTTYIYAVTSRMRFSEMAVVARWEKRGQKA